uniref:Inositol polyphosphate-related phosphatase domain-containing protein n=1 Tax=Globisporangium ultimum (strain ATCC 200006 / CBS 805.95 / DAOM BR144) TaxID=431595 RepID=K3WQT9_GLOUD
MLQTSSFELGDSSTSIRSSTETGSSSSSTFSAAALELVRASSNPSKKRTRRSRGHEVRGRGDGAFLRSKSTSIAIYVAAHLTSIIEVVRTGAHKFSFTSGSKGGLGVMLRVAGDQTITFVNCHLEANRPARRHQQLDILTRKLPKAMGMDSSKLDLAACSDHVVWMGDFNYRVHSLDGDTVLKLLGTHRHMELHDRYDSMKDDMETVPGMRPFKEAAKWPSFYPTYKKVPHRSPLVSTEDPSWPLHVYRVRYKEPFYKGGKVKARVPGWCDRILHCSSPASRTYLNVEKLPCAMASGTKKERHCTDTESNKDSRIVLRENYRSVNDALRGSDHSPVFCTFLLSVDLSPGRVLR